MRLRFFSSKKIFALVGIVLGFLFWGCTPQKGVQEEVVPIAGAEWKALQELHYSVLITNPDIPYSLEIITRHNNKYDYCTLPIACTIQNTFGWHTTDTLTLPLAQAPGRWDGSGIGIIQTSFSLEQSLFFPMCAMYDISITPLPALLSPLIDKKRQKPAKPLQEQSIRGVESIGISLKPTHLRSSR